MDKDEFLRSIQDEMPLLAKNVMSPEKDWLIKGLVDLNNTVYSLSLDTKVISKVLEMQLLPALMEFAQNHRLTLECPSQQNFYPDLTFLTKAGVKFAMDIKSTYTRDNRQVNGMTLGSFTGYFRNRESTKNILYPYSAYAEHIVLGIIYSPVESLTEEPKTYTLNEIHKIPSVIRDLQIFAQPKYRIASDRPGSGNTKNIGSITKIDDLKSGSGVFAELGEEIYDDYWMYYLTEDMARALETPRPYSNLKTYLEYKQKGKTAIETHLSVPDEEAG